MSIPFKTAPVEFHQRTLFPSRIFDLLPEDHECYLYADLFKQLDASCLEEKYSHKGQHAYHPKAIVSILIYAYSQGVFSARQIEKRCNEDLSFMLIAQSNCPNFRVLNDFRKVNGAFFHSCFKQTVQLAMELGLASLGHISLDGSKFKANTSKYKAMSYGRLKEKEGVLSKEIDELIRKADACNEEEDQLYKEQTGYEIPEDLKFKKERLSKITEAKKALEEREATRYPGKEIDDKKQISFADKEACIMGKKGRFDYGYNGQISVDKDHQIIVGQHISQNGNDQQEVEPALESVVASTGQQADKMSLDNGYMSAHNLEALESVGIDAYIATDRGEKSGKSDLDESDRKLVKADFKYNEAEDHFTCPGGQALRLIKGRQGKRVYQGDASVCAGCLYKTRCCQSDKGEARTISTDDKEPLRQRMNEKMDQETSKEIYGHRKVIVEPVFGHIKNSGFRGFSVRGKLAVAGEFSLVCAVHNVKKMIRSAMMGKVRPDFEKEEKMAA